ncbi:sodium-dependent transporter [Caproicibacter sp. BJN0012]|uniref:sodium-dependent transporter n=1 Tax=Caproicibacter sp. BJN0012 TaxID=3110227 RepID=UPI002E1222BE
MSDTSNGVETESYAGRFGAIMSMAGMCIGMGNVWRFPYMVGQFGGGSFIIAYIACLVVVVMPLALVECGLGKGLGKGLMQAFEVSLKSKKAGKVFGGVFAFSYYSMNFFYFIVVSASVYFAYASATSKWNTVRPELIYDNFSANHALMAVISVVLVIATAVILAKGVSGGIEKVSKIMIPLMFLFFIVAIFFGIFCIDGISKGYNWYIEPDLSVLAKPDVWVAAMGQALFSVGVGPGCVLVYGSHLSKTSDVTLTMTTVCLLCCCVGVITGMAIIPACIAMGLNPESGSKLIFIVLPTLFSKLPGGALIGALVFIAIFFAGISSAIAQLEVIVASFADGFGWSRKKAVFIFGGINIVAAVIAAYRESFYDFWNNFSGNYGFIVTAGIGAIVYGYIYGVEKIRANFLNPSGDIRLGKWFTGFVKFVATPIMLIIMANSLFPFLITGETSTARPMENALSATTIVTLVLIVVLLFGGTIFLLAKCLTAKEKTEEEIAEYMKNESIRQSNKERSLS